MKLSKKITLFFIIAILFSIFIVSLISNSMINNSFDKFLVGDQKKKVEQISKEINELYTDKEYNLYEKQIDSYASLENLNIKIEDLKGRLLYSSKRMSGMHNMNKKMMMNHGMSLGEYAEDRFDLTQGKEKIGTIIIGHIDNSYLTEGALIFKNTLSNILFISGIVALLIGVFTSIVLANSLTRPLVNIKNHAYEIEKGNLSKKSQLNTDITEIKELSKSINFLADSLSSQEAIRKKYASDISHELRTPLTTLKSHVEAIMDGIWEPSKEHLSILLSEINRLSLLADDLRNSFNSSEQGVVLNKTKFDLSLEVKKTVTTFMPIFNKENIEIEAYIEEDIIALMDRDKIKQVLYNLLSNCVKYIEGEGRISLSLKKEGGNKVAIVIKDNGIGMKADQLAFIFDRFYRIDKSRNSSTGGTGLGLSIVKSIVEEHGGEIIVKSIYKKGSEFFISLPLI
nr:HAMP domain-containing sensor histidine kinase [Tissierella sp.]